MRLRGVAAFGRGRPMRGNTEKISFFTGSARRRKDL